MKLIFTLVALPAVIFLFSFNKTNARSNRITYQELATTIEKQIMQNAFLSSCGDKIEKAEILIDGNILLHCSRQETVMLNIFELLKTYKTQYGFELVNNNSIRFTFSSSGSISILFKDANAASEVFDSLLRLIDTGRDLYQPDLPLDINETVDSINAMLARFSSFKAQVRVNIAGTMIITNNNMQFFNFDLSQLESSAYTFEGFEVNGIEMVPYTYGKVAANSRINFNTEKGTAAYLKFDDISDEDLATLHRLFIHLRASMISIMYS